MLKNVWMLFERRQQNMCSTAPMQQQKQFYERRIENDNNFRHSLLFAIIEKAKAKAKAFTKEIATEYIVNVQSQSQNTK